MSHYHKQGWKKTKKRRRKGKTFSIKGLPNFNFTKQSLIKNGILAIFALGILGSLFVLLMFAFVSRDLPDPNTLTDRTISQTTKIYDQSGEELLYELYGEENRTLVQIQEGFCDPNTDLQTDENGIPLFAVQATIAAEDRGFCEHHGFDLKGILRSVLVNTFTSSRVGGSTLTQQLVKNAILSNEKTYVRKMKELILSMELERRYSKDELLQIYFNEIPYGSTYYGIEAASQNYYQKQASDLTLAEAAVLAALPQSPTRYLNNPDLLKGRRDWILGEMVELGYITEEEKQIATEEETGVEVNVTNIKAPHFVFYVKEQLEEMFDQRTVEEGGLKVYTTLDYDMQEIAEEEVVEGVEALGEEYAFSNAALVAMDTNNGHILSMVGSKDFFDEEIDGQVNVSTRLRQPGSSFKPIVYTKAFDLGYTPNTVLWDVETTFATDTESYTPHNYDLEEHGPVTLRTALQGSLNIPAVKLSYLVGVEGTVDFARSLGYTSFTDYANYGLSLVLGGGEVQLLEHVGAYSVFANEGTHYEPVAILKVEDSYGEVLFEWEEEKGNEVLDENTARTISHVLKDNAARSYVFGEGSYLQLGERPVAAKTGTTNDYRDAWLVGYTPSLAVGVWVGNNDNEAMNRGAGGSVVAGPIWNGFFQRALSGEPVEYFTNPNIPTTGKAILDGSLGSTTVEVDKASELLATEYTPDSQREERTYVEYHSLLHYVDPSDPTGDIPENKDWQYESWEQAITTWLANKQEETGVTIIQGEPPTEYDDVHGPEFFPSVKIKSPDNNDSTSSRTLSVKVNAEAPRGIERVDVYLDGYFLDSDSSKPYNLSVTVPNTIARGYHTLKVVAYDDVENSGSDTIGITIDSDPVSTRFELLDPNNGQTIEKIQDTYTVVTSLQNPSEYSSITVYAQPVGLGGVEIIETVVGPSSPFTTFTWTLPDYGSYVLSARAQPADGSTALETAGIVVRVTENDNEPTQEEPTTEEGVADEEVFVSDELLDPFADAEPTETTTEE